MGLWEFTFALSAVILGLALTHIAATTHKLLLAGKRVKWAPEPVLLTTIVLLVIVTVWLASWYRRDVQTVTMVQMLLQISKLLVLYIAAASCLPEPDRTGTIDLREYYNRTRLLSFGALIVSYFLFQSYALLVDGMPKRIDFELAIDWLFYPAVYGSLIIVRRRWYNLLALGFAMAMFGWAIAAMRLTA